MVDPVRMPRRHALLIDCGHVVGAGRGPGYYHF